VRPLAGLLIVLAFATSVRAASVPPDSGKGTLDSSGPAGSFAPAGNSDAAELAQIVLSISPRQVVDKPWVISAQVFLFDENSNPVTDYDLAANPIQLVASSGQLIPDILDDPALFNAGVIDFLPAAVRYQGTTGQVGITAVSGAVSSTEVLVVFSGYDVLSAFDALGEPIDTIYANLLTTIQVLVQNLGDLVAQPSPSLRSFFRSGGGSVKSFISPKANGAIDTVVIDLPTENLGGGPDTLILELTSEYQISDSIYATSDTLLVPVTVQLPAVLEFAEGSFVPDSVYAGEAFDVSFQVVGSGFSGVIDTSVALIRLYGDTTQPPLATIYDGGPVPERIQGDTVFYEGLTALVDAAAGLIPGSYMVRLDFYLISSGSVYTLDLRYPDSLFILPPAALSYVEGTFSPLSVSAGAKVAFSFDLLLEDALPLEIEPSGDSFTVTGSGFSTTAGLDIPGQMLSPGVNTVSTDSVFIPSEQLGQSLSLSASLGYRLSGSANYLPFTSDFSGETVLVEELPQVQVREVFTIAPNRPKVNTLQEFSIRCRIENSSGVTVDSLPIQMTSDGESSFEPVHVIGPIDAHQTVETFIDVVAGPESNPAEVFEVRIIPDGFDVLPPVDNIATVTIQEPARLQLSRTLPGGETGYVGRGSSFGMVINLANAGEAAVSPGVFRLTTGGVDLGVEDPLTDTIRVGVPYSLTFFAPTFDTTLVLSFELMDLPIDLNDSLPAEIDTTSFEVRITVASLDAHLLVESQVQLSNLLLPGETRELFRLSLTNRADSDVDTIRLDTVGLRFTGPRNQPLEVTSVLNVTESGFFENGLRLSSSSSAVDRLYLTFDDFLLDPGDQRVLSFFGSLGEGASGEFRLNLDVSQIRAVFISGPQSGQAVAVASGTGDTSALAETFTPVASRSARGSFTIKDNPFNPLVEPAEFQFFLPEPSAVELRIFTLTGEEVVSLVYPEGFLPSGRLVPLGWDGRNGSGDFVLNGVYIALLRIVKSGDEALLKVAVVK